MSENLSISTVHELHTFGLPAAAFTDRAASEGLRELRYSSFPAQELTLAQLCVLGEVELAQTTDRGAWALLRVDPRMLVLLSAARGHVDMSVAGVDRDAVDRVTADFTAVLRDPEPDASRVPVTFWAQANGRPMNPRRSIEASAWRDISHNYGASARGALDELMAAPEPGAGGLLLWHGEPGTGKSHALRALARAWRGWCETHFVTDPDAFLGTQTNYLLNALLRSPDDSRWRLIVLEDAGELLAADARAVAGQALSRLLNLTDGLLGAGLQAIALVTTNEPLRRMHPAVARPGRTWAQVEFPALSATESNAWLERQGADARVERPATLAELYALADGRPVRESPLLGFVG